jgi:hypothetical protein
MPQFTVDDDLAALVEKLAKPKPFENLTFNNALRRVLTSLTTPRKEVDDELEQLLKDAMAEAALKKKEVKKTPSPSARKWVDSVPELQNKKALGSWREICNFLKIDVGRDSARRALKSWVKAHKPDWPSVPEVDSDTWGSKTEGRT